MSVFDRQVYCPNMTGLDSSRGNASPRRIERQSKRPWPRSLSKYQIVREKRRGSVSATGATPHRNVTDSFGDVARLAFYVEDLPIGGVLSQEDVRRCHDLDFFASTKVVRLMRKVRPHPVN